MSKPVVIVGALDTKGEEFRFVRDLIRARGLDTVVVDFGVLGEPAFTPDIGADEVARAGGHPPNQFLTVCTGTNGLDLRLTAIITTDCIRSIGVIIGISAPVVWAIGAATIWTAYSGLSKSHTLRLSRAWGPSAAARRNILRQA